MEGNVGGDVMVLSKRFEEAFLFAHELHGDQVRKGSTTPYISHLMAVSSLVLEHGGDEDQAIAALLHDAIEDRAKKFGGVSALREAILQRFGPRVLEIVEGCTDADEEPKPPWEERKITYIEHIAKAPDHVRLVSMADKVHNARSILTDLRTYGQSVWQRFQGRRDGSLWYYRSLIRAFCQAGPHPLIDELEQVVQELECLSGVSEAVERV
jgi:(p)ppGpp synthase/HD superfamily hydrolase